MFLFLSTEITPIFTVYLPESFKWVYVWGENKCTAQLYNMTVIKRKKTRSVEEKKIIRPETRVSFIAHRSHLIQEEI